jgi:hypothetical protein
MTACGPSGRLRNIGILPGRSHGKLASSLARRDRPAHASRAAREAAITSGHRARGKRSCFGLSRQLGPFLREVQPIL